MDLTEEKLFKETISFSNTNDFYTRNDGSTFYKTGILEVTDELSILILQIETCLFTRKKQVLGQYDFGANLEDLIFTLVKNESDIKSKILSQIYSYCPLAPKYNVDVKVEFIKTELRDVCYIDIVIDNKLIQTILI